MPITFNYYLYTKRTKRQAFRRGMKWYPSRFLVGIDYRFMFSSSFLCVWSFVCIFIISMLLCLSTINLTIQSSFDYSMYLVNSTVASAMKISHCPEIWFLIKTRLDHSLKCLSGIYSLLFLLHIFSSVLCGCRCLSYMLLFKFVSCVLEHLSNIKMCKITWFLHV